MAFTKVVGPGIHTLAQLRTHNIHSAGIITATRFVGEIGAGTGSTSTFTNVNITGDLTVQGDTTTLNTTLRNVELLRVAANSNTAAGIVTQTGTGDILNLYDGATEVFSVADGGNITATGSLNLGNTLYWDGDNTTTIDNAGISSTFRFKTGGTTVMDITAGKNVHIKDDRQLLIGASNDLTIYHSSSANKSYVTSATHDVIHSFNVGKPWTLQTTAAEKRIYCPTTKSVELYWNGTKKFETSGSGTITSGISTVTGVIDAQGYINLAQKIVHTGDADTSIEFDTNIIKFETQGSERIRIDSDGDVGIGTANPGSNGERLIVRKDLAAASGKAIISIYNLHQGTSGQSNESTGALEFIFKNHNAAHNWWGGRIACFNTDNYNQYTYLRFDTASQGNASEKMRLTHNGKLGIGTDNPAQRVTSYTASGYCFLANGPASGIGLGNNGAIVFGTKDLGSYAKGILDATELEFKVSGNPKFNIDTSGRVGIGTVAPGEKLDVEGALRLRAGGNWTTYATRITSRLDSTHMLSLEAYHNSSTPVEVLGTYADGGGANVRTVIAAGGMKVGIGTDEPFSNLTVYGENRSGGGSVTGQITAKDNAAWNASPTCGLVFQGHYHSNGANAIFGGITGFKENGTEGNYAGALAFHVRKNGAVSYEAARISSDGKLGINTSTFTSGSGKESIMQIKAPTGYNALGIGATTFGIRFGWDGDVSAYDDIRIYNVDYGNSGTFGVAGNNPTFVLTPTAAPGSGVSQQTVWLKSTGRGSGNNEMNLMVDGDLVVGGSGKENGVAVSGYPGSKQHGTGVSKVTIQPDNRTSAFDPSDGDTWHDVILHQGGSATNNAVGIAFQLKNDGSYHKNAGTGIAAVKNGTNSDYGADLVFITRGQSEVASEKLRITSTGVIQAKSLSGTYYPVASIRDGSTTGRAATSAWEIKKTLGPAANTGYYYLKNPHDSNVDQWWCDMKTDGGGWILVAHHSAGTLGSDPGHWYNRDHRGGFRQDEGATTKKGGGYWQTWGDLLGEIMIEVRIHGIYEWHHGVDSDDSLFSGPCSKVGIHWGRGNNLPAPGTGDGGYGNLPASRALRNWCWEIENAPGFNPGNYSPGVQQTIINGSNNFTEHFLFTWSMRNTSGPYDQGESGPYWQIGSHHDGLHQHYEESASGDSYGDGRYQIHSGHDTTWTSDNHNIDGMRALGKLSSNGIINYWMR